MSASSRPESQRYESATNQFIYDGIVHTLEESTLGLPAERPDNKVASPTRPPRAGPAASLAVDYSELCLQAEKLRLEKLELEQSNMVLRKYKKVYRLASRVTCSGCNETFKPVPFKGHVVNCRFLEELEESETANDPAAKQDMTIKVLQADDQGQIKFLLTYCGISWYTVAKIEDLQFVVRKLQDDYPHLSALTGQGAEEFLSLEAFRMSKAQSIELVSTFTQELVKFEVVRNDLSVRVLFQINEKLEEEQRRKSKYQTKSVSLLRIAKQNAAQV